MELFWLLKVLVKHDVNLIQSDIWSTLLLNFLLIYLDIWLVKCLSFPLNTKFSLYGKHFGKKYPSMYRKYITDNVICIPSILHLTSKTLFESFAWKQNPCLLRVYLLLLLFILYWIMTSSERNTAGTDELLKIKILFSCKYL